MRAGLPASGARGAGGGAHRPGGWHRAWFRIPGRALPADRATPGLGCGITRRDRQASPPPQLLRSAPIQPARRP